MAKINDTTDYPSTTPADADLLIGTDVSNTTNDANGETVNFTVQSVRPDVASEGTTSVTGAAAVNFTGAGVSVTDAGSGQADIAIGSYAAQPGAVLIGTYSLNGQLGSGNEIDVDLTGYAGLDFSFRDVSFSTSQNISMRFSDDGGTTFFSGAADYTHCKFRDGSTQVNQTTSEIYLGGHSSGVYATGVVTGLNTADAPPHARYVMNSAGANVWSGFAALAVSAGAVDTVRFFAGANATGGTLTIWGVPKARSGNALGFVERTYTDTLTISAAASGEWTIPDNCTRFEWHIVSGSMTGGTSANPYIKFKRASDATDASFSKGYVASGPTVASGFENTSTIEAATWYCDGASFLRGHGTVLWPRSTSTRTRGHADIMFDEDHYHSYDVFEAVTAEDHDTMAFVTNAGTLTITVQITYTLLEAEVGMQKLTFTSATAMTLAQAPALVESNLAADATHTLPANAPTGTVVEVTEIGTATTTVAAPAGETLDGVTAGTKALSAQYSVVAFTKLSGGWVSAAAGGSVATQSEGTAVVNPATTLNFTGAGVSVSDAGGGQADIAIGSYAAQPGAVLIGTYSLNGQLGTGNEIVLDTEGYSSFAFGLVGGTFGVADIIDVQASTDGTTWITSNYSLDCYGDASATSSTLPGLSFGAAATTNAQRAGFYLTGVDTGLLVFEGSSATSNRRGYVNTKDVGAAVKKLRVMAKNGNNATGGTLAIWGVPKARSGNALGFVERTYTDTLTISAAASGEWTIPDNCTRFEWHIVSGSMTGGASANPYVKFLKASDASDATFTKGYAASGGAVASGFEVTSSTEAVKWFCDGASFLRGHGTVLWPRSTTIKTRGHADVMFDEDHYHSYSVFEGLTAEDHDKMVFVTGAGTLTITVQITYTLLEAEVGMQKLTFTSATAMTLAQAPATVESNLSARGTHTLPANAPSGTVIKFIERGTGRTTVAAPAGETLNDVTAGTVTLPGTNGVREFHKHSSGWVSSGGGELVLAGDYDLSVNTLDAGNEIDIDALGAKGVEVHVYGVTYASADEVAMRVSNDGGSTFKSGATDYELWQLHHTVNTASADLNRIGITVSNTSEVFGSARFMGLNSSGHQLTGHGYVGDSTVGYARYSKTKGISDIDYLRFFSTSGGACTGGRLVVWLQY